MDKNRRIIVVLSQNNSAIFENIDNKYLDKYKRYEKYILPERYVSGLNSFNSITTFHQAHHELIVDDILCKSSFAEPAVIFTHSEAIVLSFRIAVLQKRLESFGVEIQILDFDHKDWIIEVDEFGQYSKWPEKDFWGLMDLRLKFLKLQSNLLNK